MYGTERNDGIRWMRAMPENEGVPVIFGNGFSLVSVNAEGTVFGNFSFVYTWFSDELVVIAECGKRVLTGDMLNERFVTAVKHRIWFVKSDYEKEPGLNVSEEDIRPTRMTYGENYVSMDGYFHVGGWDLNFMIEKSNGLVSSPHIYSSWVRDVPVPACWAEDTKLCLLIRRVFLRRIEEDERKRAERKNKRKEKLPTSA